MPRVWENGLPLDSALFTRFATLLGRLLPWRGRFQTAASARLDHSLYGLRPSHDITSGEVVINDTLPSRILSGRVQVRPDIACLTSPSTVQFSDGSEVADIDAVICATGE